MYIIHSCIRNIDAYKHKLLLMNDVCNIKDTWTSLGQICPGIGTNKIDVQSSIYIVCNTTDLWERV